MAKKSRIVTASSKRNAEDHGKILRKKPSNRKGKRKTPGDSWINQDSTPKKVRFSESKNMAPILRDVKLDDDKGEKQKKTKFMKNDLRTIKKAEKTVFDRVKLTPAGKPNWKELKQLSIKLTKERKERKQSHYEIIIRIKRLWEITRRENTPIEKKAKDVIVLHDLMQNQLNKLVYAHDTSRIVQGLIKLGSPSVRKAIVDELAPNFQEMLQKKFSSFCMKSIIKHGDTTCKAKVLESMKGNCVKLLTNTASAPLVEQMYSQHALPDQKTSMEQEFLGTIRHTINIPSDGNIVTIVSELNHENKTAALEKIKENILKILSKGNTSSLLCNVTLQYLEVCSKGDKQEVLELLFPHILDLMSTKSGSRLGVQCIWFMDKKFRKQIVKRIKGHIVSLSTSEHGFWAILALLDSMDDTVLLNKVVVAEIANNATTLLETDNGRKVLLYLVAHRDTAHFHPSDLKFLSQGDESTFSLKCMETKREEIEPVVDDLLQCIIDKMEIWLKDAKVAMVTLAILKKGKGGKLHEALSALAKYVCSDITIDQQPFIENAGMNLVLKKLLKCDEIREDDSEKFSVQLASIVNDKNISKWIACNRGCFLLVGVLEAKSDKAIKSLVSKITEEIYAQLAAEKNIGARVLNKVLSLNNTV